MRLSRPGAWAAAVLIITGCEQAPQQVSHSGKGAYEASLQTAPGGFVVAWHDYRDGNAEIYARVLDVDRHQVGPEVRLTRSETLSFEADVDVIGEDLVVAWYERPREGAKEAWVGRWTRSGESRWKRRLSRPDDDGRNPLVQVIGEKLFCAWLEKHGGETEVWGRWFDVTGAPLAKRARLGLAGGTTWNLNAVSRPDGSLWVVFDAVVGTQAAELYLVEVAPPVDGQPTRTVRLTADDGYASTYPDIDVGHESGRIALTWFDERDGNREIYLAVLSEKALAVGQIEAQRVRVTNNPGQSIGAYLAWNGDRIGLAWSDEVDGQHEIFFTSFDASGRSSEAPQQLTANPTASLIPAIAPWDEGFALVWNEDVIDERGTHETGGNSEVVFSLVR